MSKCKFQQCVFLFLLSILILSYTVNVVCNNKRRMCFLNAFFSFFFNKKTAVQFASDSWLSVQQKMQKKVGAGSRDTNMHQREKKLMRLHTQQDGYSFLLRSACTFRIWLRNMHVHGYFHKGRVTTQHRSKTAAFFPV